MSHWNYRVVKNEFEVGIKEVYYNKDGEICAMTDDFIYPVGEDYEEFTSSMNAYIEALTKPVLDESEIDFAKANWNDRLSKVNFTELKEALLDEAWEDEDDFEDDYYDEEGEE